MGDSSTPYDTVAELQQTVCERAQHNEGDNKNRAGYLPHAPEDALAVLLHALQADLAHLVPPFRLVLR